MLAAGWCTHSWPPLRQPLPLAQAMASETGVRQDLEAYCALATLGMVQIVDQINRLIL